jgi:hypothetical protein
VAPWLTLALLVICRSALGLTVKDAVTVEVLVPKAVVSEPAGKVFVPDTKLVTTTETEQEDPGGITVPFDTVKDAAPGVAVTVELTQEVDAKGAAELLMLAGYESKKADVKVADTNWCVLMKVMTKREVPPALIEVGENDLDIVGRLGVIGSESATVQVPVAQPTPVLVTPEGTEMRAVLVTWVCECAV